MVGEGDGNRGGGGGHNFLRLRKGREGRVVQIYPCDHVEVHPQKKKEVLYLVKKKKKEGQRNIMDIIC